MSGLTREAMIQKLRGTAPSPIWLVDKQTVGDIIAAVKAKHIQCAADYDKIYLAFDDDSVINICYNLWSFCKKNFNYVIEDEDAQITSCPYTILSNGVVDCKNYSLFIAGVLDAFKRHGRKLTWRFRFASYDLFDPSPGHVFVVVNPSTTDIWVDPVLDTFNEHLFYWYKKDREVKTGASIAGINHGFSSKIGSSAEQNLLDQLHQYTEGLVGAITLTQQTNTFNAITKQFVQGITGNVPGIAQGLAFLGKASTVINNDFGPGSPAAMLFADYAANPLLFPISAIQTLFNGRTYNTDQYWGAAYYYYHVLGKANYTNQTAVSDSQVIPALKWFIDRTGVFISGREHIDALTVGEDAYMAYSKVNAYTTTDYSRVHAAVAVAERYWSNSNQFVNPGGWAGTIGVFDTGLAQLAASLGMTAEQYVAQTGTSAASSDLIDGISNVWIYGGLAALVLYALIKKK